MEFVFTKATKEIITRIITSLNPNKVIGSFFKLVRRFLFTDKAKGILVTLIPSKMNRQNKEKYRPVNIWSNSSKITKDY